MDDLHTHHHDVPPDGHSRAQSWLETQLSLYFVAFVLAASMIPRLLTRFGKRETATHHRRPTTERTLDGKMNGMFDTAPRKRRIDEPHRNDLTRTPAQAVGYLGEYNPYIQSEQALHQSPQFWQHLSHQDIGHMARVKSKMDTYRTLRRLDPSSFQQLWDDPYLQEQSTEHLPAAAALIEYSAPVLLTTTLLQWALAGHGVPGGVCLLVWLALQLRAMSKGHTSCVGAWVSVYGNTPKSDSCCCTAGLPRLLAAHALEVVHVCCTLGVGAVLSAACRCWSSNQQSFGELCLQVFPVREVRRPVPFSMYAPT